MATRRKAATIHNAIGFLCALSCSSSLAQTPMGLPPRYLLSQTPSFSHDGKYLAMVCWPSRGPRSPIHVVETQDWQPVGLNWESIYATGDVAWSPNTARYVVTVIAHEDAGGRDWLVDVDAGTRIELKTLDLRCGPWKWSPDGTMLLTTISNHADLAERQPDSAAVFVFKEAMNWKATKVFPLERIEYDGIEWFTDSTTFLVATAENVNAPRTQGIYQAFLDGRPDKKISDTRFARKMGRSPLGDKIVISNGSGRKVILDVVTGASTPFRAVRYPLPRWRPDGKRLVYASIHGVHVRAPSEEDHNRKIVVGSKGKIVMPFWDPRDSSLWGVLMQRAKEPKQSEVFRFDGKKWVSMYKIPEEQGALPLRDGR